MNAGGFALGAALRTLPWATVILVWYLIPTLGLVNPALVPTPAQVLATFWDLLTMHRLWFDMLMSLQRVLLGLVLGVALAIPVGFVLGWYRPMRTLIDPLVNFFCAAISSDATSVAQHTPSATRSAVSTCGTASGTMTRRKISPSVAPRLRATRM